MKLIEPGIINITQTDFSRQGIYKQIEAAARTCYKSEDNTTKDSAERFTQCLINAGHTAMLEHGTVILHMRGLAFKNVWDILNKYNIEPHSQIHVFPDAKKEGDTDTFVITNYRVIVENDWFEDLYKFGVAEVPAEYASELCRPAFRIVCDCGVGREITRHRVFSFAQESTRYCNYSKDKFGHEISYVRPHWYNTATERQQQAFVHWLADSERQYMRMIEDGFKPQDARGVLPLALKTELVVTGFNDGWKHFFDLRLASNAHPDVRIIAEKLREQFPEQIPE